MIKLSSLFVGRWQPFHEGHKKLIETVLKDGKSVVIAIRDTERSTVNPYTTSERWGLIQKSLREYGDLVKIIVIPDIDEICYGREVGYGIRKIELHADIEQISGTKIRNSLHNTKPIIWLTGQSGSGKTTIANRLKEKIGGVLLDGDDMRQSVSSDLGFSKKDRIEHNLRIAKLAAILSKDTEVIVSLITPFEDLRGMVTEIAKPIWIYIERKIEISLERPFEIPNRFDLKVNSDKQTVDEQVSDIINLLKNRR